jgi:hypothetical protein
MPIGEGQCLLCHRYGQSALFVAAWHGHIRVVDLLLQCGADGLRCASGGLAPIDAAAAGGHHLVVAALQQQYGFHAMAAPAPGLSDEPLSGAVHAERLIDGNVAHAGAGACFIDGGFSAGFLAWLEALFAVLPVAEREKQSCNDRRYSAHVAPGLAVASVESSLASRAGTLSRVLLRRHRVLREY